MNALIRPLSEPEYPLLERFLYEAIFLPEGVRPPPFSILQRPELQVYLAGFGARPDDLALAAEVDGRVVGAVWSRIMEDYGHVDHMTPSLAISLLPQYRGAGIGTALMGELLSRLRRRGYPRVSLSVQRENRAVGLYRKVGFSVLEEKGEELIMVCPLGGGTSPW